jgi:limonene-1,2-epoxide hydrolase
VLIKVRQGELAARFQRDHGRPPTPVEALQLAQQATLETRDPKHEPRSLAEQHTAWHAQAAETLGGPEAIQAMINKALNPISIQGAHVDAEWVATTAEKVLAAVEERRSTWQSWHVRAEAHRHVRAAEIDTDKVDQLVELLLTEVLQTRSISLTRPDDEITEPEALRRVDGSSVYTVAGSELFTSTRILAAEQRLITTAGRTDGRILDAATVELALLESAANGNALDAGQTALVRSMCTSGARLQLAIAPAGAGKTTAMRTLAQAWADSGGQVVGLAPSAAAATQLRDATGAPAETLAKLTWSIHHNDLPEWAERIGRSSLVIIDEAGMADTLTLDTAVQFIIGRGGSIRLIGDDQQLAAVGVGGVLRDIQASYGAVRLTELRRFTDPAEAAATLAVRDGRTEALGFYLDRQRVGEVLGVNLTSAEDGAGWLAFFRDLTVRGLSGVSLVTSDAHPGLVAALGATLPGTGWQRCRTHYAANLMAITPKASWGWVKALLHSVYDQPDAASVHAQFDRIVDALADKLPRVAEHLDAARADILAFTAFPKELWRQIWSNNPLSVNRPELQRLAAAA